MAQRLRLYKRHACVVDVIRSGEGNLRQEIAFTSDRFLTPCFRYSDVSDHVPRNNADLTEVSTVSAPHFVSCLQRRESYGGQSCIMHSGPRM